MLLAGSGDRRRATGCRRLSSSLAIERISSLVIVVAVVRLDDHGDERSGGLGEGIANGVRAGKLKENEQQRTCRREKCQKLAV